MDRPKHAEWLDHLPRRLRWGTRCSLGPFPIRSSLARGIVALGTIALEYCVNGKEFWDNSHGSNSRIVLQWPDGLSSEGEEDDNAESRPHLNFINLVALLLGRIHHTGSLDTSLWLLHLFKRLQLKCFPVQPKTMHWPLNASLVKPSFAKCVYITVTVFCYLLILLCISNSFVFKSAKNIHCTIDVQQPSSVEGLIKNGKQTDKILLLLSSIGQERSFKSLLGEAIALLSCHATGWMEE